MGILDDFWIPPWDKNLFHSEIVPCATVVSTTALNIVSQDQNLVNSRLQWMMQKYTDNVCNYVNILC